MYIHVPEDGRQVLYSTGDKYCSAHTRSYRWETSKSHTRTCRWETSTAPTCRLETSMHSLHILAGALIMYTLKRKKRYKERYPQICIRENLELMELTWLYTGSILNFPKQCTVKSGNFVTFFAQNIFFHKIMWRYPIFFFLVGNSEKNCFRC